MKRIHLGLFLLLSVFFFGCQKEIHLDSGVTPTPAATTNRIVQGNVLDEYGQPLSGVTVRAGNQSATTDNRGYFRMRDAQVNGDAALVTAEKTAYFKGYRVFRATTGANQVTIQLIKKASAGDVDAAAGGSATLSNGARVALPANGVVTKSDGLPYTGTVKVYAAYIDPSATNIPRILPGSFMADDAAGRRVTLASYGMMAVELESPAGVKLQVKDGSEATLTMPIPSSLQSGAPATISLWYVDEQTGIWKEQGSATKTGATYVGNVKHFSFWNCDVSATAVNLSMTLKDTHGAPLVHAQVKLTRTIGSSQFSSYGYTDSLGQVGGLVPSNEQLLMQVLDPCQNVVASQTIGPFSQATNIGTVTVTLPASSTVTVQGKLTNCSNAAVTSGYAMVWYDNVLRYVNVDASGNYSVLLLSCSASSGSVTVVGVDRGGQQQSSDVTVPLTFPVTNAGTISACGSTTNAFMNYTIDGTAYTINSSMGAGTADSLVAYRDSSNTNSGRLTGMGTHTPDYLNFYTNASASAGTYPLTGLSVSPYGMVQLVAPFNLTITNYPATAAGFLEGSFSGQFTDASNATHTINCTFRLRRAW